MAVAPRAVGHAGADWERRLRALMHPAADLPTCPSMDTGLVGVRRDDATGLYAAEVSVCGRRGVKGATVLLGAAFRTAQQAAVAHDVIALHMQQPPHTACTNYDPFIYAPILAAARRAGTTLAQLALATSTCADAAARPAPPSCVRRIVWTLG